jgi:hypothetical protein
VITTPASYSGYHEFKSWSVDRLSCLRLCDFPQSLKTNARIDAINLTEISNEDVNYVTSQFLFSDMKCSN